MSGYAGTGALLEARPCAATGSSSPSASSASSPWPAARRRAPSTSTRARTPSTRPGRCSASPAIVGMYGPIANPDNPDSFAIFKTLLLRRRCVALLAIVLVRRHTRTEEEAGRTELVGAGAVGRRAPLTAAVILAVGTVLVASLLAALSLIGSGLGSRGSWAFGLAWATVGLTFTGVAAVAAQLTDDHPGAGAWAFGALGVSYLLRAIGDTASGPVSGSPGSPRSAGPRRSRSSATTGSSSRSFPSS